MAAPSDPFLQSFNSNIESLVTETSELVTFVVREQYLAGRDIEEGLVHIFTRQPITQTLDPVIMAVQSINGQDVTEEHLAQLKHTFPPVAPEGTYHVDVTFQVLINKGIDPQRAVFELFSGDLGDVNFVKEVFVTQIIKEGSCPAPITKVVDINPVA